ncbi:MULTISPECIES: molecular chaperone DnaJ [unclassified Acinetobacter]|uniref:molecular chaperone DnaJ n=1 Tax=unclassified Acinetobacter TaxID=196816 RepID=UPI0015D2BD4E|nr:MULTISPECIES: molecular chaperone DnaJ [unclassified Acinetobacter]
MSFELKVSLLPSVEALSRQHKKLNKLIEQIEQQKLDLDLWQNAKSEIQSYIQLKLVPIYRDLHAVYFRQLAQLWQHLQQEDFAKADLAQLDAKLAKLAKQLKKSNYLNTAELEKVSEVDAFYQQHHAHNQKPNRKTKSAQTEQSKVKGHTDIEQEATEEYESYEAWDSEQYQREKEEHQRRRLAQKREQAEKLVNQSLKTVYLKIASIIHPDREPDESKKAEKTELLQRANEAYEQEDLFFLLKLQLEVEQSKNGSNKGLSAEQVKFYQQALEAQSQSLKQQIQELIDSLVWSNKAKIAVQKSKGQLNIEQLYKQIDADVSTVKQQLKAEKQRLSFMGKESGLEMLLEHGGL